MLYFNRKSIDINCQDIPTRVLIVSIDLNCLMGVVIVLNIRNIVVRQK